MTNILLPIEIFQCSIIRIKYCKKRLCKFRQMVSAFWTYVMYSRSFALFFTSCTVFERRIIPNLTAIRNKRQISKVNYQSATQEIVLTAHLVYAQLFFSNVDLFSFQVLSCTIFLAILVISNLLKLCANSRAWNLILSMNHVR